ncbi:MAG: Asp-tRNA(Asn)/Glu-tRNA(Gln) amidotransferase subunit GatC [Patescibacteria group bacterium]
MQITNDETKKIAGLIRIHLEDSEVTTYTDQLNTVLSAVDVLKELDTAQVQETSQTHGLTNIVAEDEPTFGLSINEYPKMGNLQKSYFVVDKVL